MKGTKMGLGALLVAEGVISQGQLNEALAKQRETGAFLGDVLAQMNALRPDALTSFIVKHCRIPYVSLLDYLVDEKLLSLIPKDLCRKRHLLPIDKMGRNLTVAMVDPLDEEALAEVRRHCSDLVVKPILCDSEHFKTIARRLLGADEEAAEAESELSMSSLGLAPSAPAPKPAPQQPAPEPATPAASPVLPQQPAPPAAPSAAAAPRVLAWRKEKPKTDELVSMMHETMQETYEVLIRRIDLFRGLEPDFVARIFAAGATAEVTPDTIIFQKGDPGDKLYVILSGEVEISEDGVKLATLTTGDTFGEMTLVSGEPRSATAVARQTTSLFMLDDTVFQRLMNKQVAIRILLNLLGAMSERLRKANRTIAELQKK